QKLDLQLGDDDARSMVFSRIYHGSNGMFLWASLMMHTVRSATSPQEILEGLTVAPSGLGTLYDSILDKISRQPSNRCRLARTTLLWTCCAARPLRWPELETVLAFDSALGRTVGSRKPFKSAVLESCSPLVEHIHEDD